MLDQKVHAQGDGQMSTLEALEELKGRLVELKRDFNKIDIS